MTVRLDPATAPIIPLDRPSVRRCGWVRVETGTVTAETAVLLPALVVLVALSMWAVAVVGAQLRCVDAARTAARALARGESEPLARQAALDAAPEGAALRLRRDRDLVAVRVTATAALPGPWGATGPGVQVSGEAVAATER